MGSSRVISTKRGATRLAMTRLAAPRAVARVGLAVAFVMTALVSVGPAAAGAHRLTLSAARVVPADADGSRFAVTLPPATPAVRDDVAGRHGNLPAGCASGFPSSGWAVG